VTAVGTCETSLGGTHGLTLVQCTSGPCTNKQAAIDCLVALPCGSDLASYETAGQACLVAGGCNVQ
jgi:hypothetical protein